MLHNGESSRLNASENSKLSASRRKMHAGERKMRANERRSASWSYDDRGAVPTPTRITTSTFIITFSVTACGDYPRMRWSSIRWNRLAPCPALQNDVKLWLQESQGVVSQRSGMPSPLRCPDRPICDYDEDPLAVDARNYGEPSWFPLFFISRNLVQAAFEYDLEYRVRREDDDDAQ